jgi:ribosome biogenesis GTPase / thiamine phosphate phosphatase
VNLEAFGWNPFFSDQFEPFARDGLAAGRVALEHRGAYRLWTESGEVEAEASGRLRHDARDRGELPAVGDWVAFRPGATASVRAVLARRGAFARKVAGARAERQIVAANVDTVFLVTGLDGDFNVRRIERYLTVAWESGARPVVVLNKADVCDDLASCVAETEAVSAGVPVVVSSAAAGDVSVFDPHLRPGETVALLGSSGVGKSTITNRLLGGEAQRTAEVREHDGRGRHTTTRRELFLLPSGALLVDTPGMRELQVWAGEGDGIGGAFADVEEVARRCRFADCRHGGEPGCAVAEALDAGSLDRARFDNYVALERELAYAARRTDQRLRLAEKQRWKAIHKAQRQHYKKT